MKKLLSSQSYILWGLFVRTVFVSLVTASSVNAVTYSPYQVFKKGRFDVNVQTQFFKTEANFSSGGQKDNLAASNYLQNLEVTPTVRWELIEDLGLIAGFNIASSESSDQLATRKNSTFNRIDVGADLMYWNSDYHESFFRLIYSKTLEPADFATDSVFNSEGTNEIKPEVVFRFDFEGIYPFFQGGLNFRSEGLSHLLTYGIGAEARFAELGLGAAIYGRASVSDDSHTNTPGDRDIVNNRVNAGSKKYFAVNPNSTDLEVNLNFAFNQNMLLKIFGGYTLIGSNSAVGYTVGADLNFNFNLGGISTSRSTHSTAPVYREKISRDPTPQDFKEDTNDGVNQEYFKPVKPQDKSYIQQIEGSPQGLKNATTSEDEERLREEQQKLREQQEIKKKVNEMEYTIKLKRKKLKKK